MDYISKLHYWLMFQISLFKPGDGCCVLDTKQSKFETPKHILVTATRLSEIPTRIIGFEQLLPAITHTSLSEDILSRSFCEQVYLEGLKQLHVAAQHLKHCKTWEMPVLLPILSNACTTDQVQGSTLSCRLCTPFLFHKLSQAQPIIY